MMYSSVSKTDFATRAANNPPINGATIKIHNSDNAEPPAKTAGAMLRAGLTEVPVKGMPTK